MSRLDIYIHRPAANARASRRVRDAAVSGAKFWGQFTVAQLNRELSDWKRELKDATKPADTTYAKQQIAGIEKEIASRRTGDKKSFADTIRDSLGAGLIGGNEKPEGRHAKNTPLVADGKGVLTDKLSKMIDDYRAKRVTRKQLEEEFRKAGISMSDLRYLLDEED